jgi:general secretion pathway protein I
MKQSRPRSASSGFTLIEIMVAFAILSLTLVTLLGIVTNNVRATNHAKMTTAATFLARIKMSDVEDQVLYEGFTTDTENAHGTFKEDGYPQFRWETMIERIELPTDMTQKSQDKARETSNDAKDPMSMMTGFLGGMMSSFIEPIRIGLQESVRKVTVRVLWDETGRRDQTMEVVQYLTDPSKLDASLTGGAPGAGAPNTTTGGIKPPGTGNLLQGGGPPSPFNLGGLGPRR